MTKSITLGFSKNITVNIHPVFEVEATLIKNKHRNDHTSIITPTSTVNINLRATKTSIISNISNATLEWLFLDSNKKELASVSSSTTIKKHGDNFSLSSLKPPLEQAIDEKDLLLGKKGLLGARVLIENVDPITIIPEENIEWDFTFNYKYDNKLLTSRLSNSNYNTGKHLDFTCTRGASIPYVYKNYLVLWETDSASKAIEVYKYKANADKSISFKLSEYQETESEVLEYTTTSTKRYYLGCNQNKKITYGNDEPGGTPNRFEINSMSFLAKKIEKTNEYLPLKDLKPLTKKMFIIDSCWFIKRPEIIFKTDIQEIGEMFTYFAEITIKNMSFNVNVSDVNFDLYKKSENKYSKEISMGPFSMQAQKYEIISSGSRKWKWNVDISGNQGGDQYVSEGAYVKKNNSIILRYGITFMDKQDAQDYRLIFPFIDLISDPDKNRVELIFKNLQNQLKCQSLKKSGYNLVNDPDNKYHYASIDIR